MTISDRALSGMTEAELVDLRRRAKERIKELRDVPTEPTVGAVLAFTKYFQGSTPYHYAAIHTPTGWSVTGRKNLTNIPWNELVAFMKENERETISVHYRVFDGLRVSDTTVRPAKVADVPNYFLRQAY